MGAKIDKKLALVTGAAGFIGFHISRRLLENGWRVIGLDCMSNYYDVSLKEQRENILLKHSRYKSIHKRIEEQSVLKEIFEDEKPSIVIHMAAQAGVRFSIQNPRSYLESNINGTFELLEAARSFPPSHMLLASSSSVYGGNRDFPHKETTKADDQISFYAATKKATENMAHSYSHLYDLPITMLRFFTVYGPWGRPDMALFKFTNAILDGKKIDIYNHGDMSRDFTYIDDVVRGICFLVDMKPSKENEKKSTGKSKEKVPLAPFRVVNIGNSKSEKIANIVDELEKSLKLKAKKNFMPMQQGDLSNTLAHTALLEDLTGYKPQTGISEGVASFVKWYRSHYKV